MYFQIFWKNYCRETIEATTAKKVPNERKLIYAIYNFIVASWCFGDVKFSVNGNREILLKMYVRFKRDLLENQNYNLF